MPALSPNADVLLSEILHDSFAVVDETGVEAAASTGIALFPKSLKRQANPEYADLSHTADLKSGLRLSVDSVVHHVAVETNEEGSEAAAATAVLYHTRAKPRPPSIPLPFHVDRPCAIIIRRKKENMALFMGLLVNPSYSRARF